jgi:hypothetical protein
MDEGLARFLVALCRPQHTHPEWILAKTLGWTDAEVKAMVERARAHGLIVPDSGVLGTGLFAHKKSWYPSAKAWQMIYQELKSADLPTLASPSSLRVFVSHSSSDAEVVHRLVECLRAALPLSASTIRCTSLDGYRLSAGDETERQLRMDVTEAMAFLGVISADSLQSTFVLFELGARWGIGRHLIPLLVPGFDSKDLRPPLDGLNALRIDSEDQMHQLIADVGARLNIQPERANVYGNALRQLCTTL